VTAVIWRPRARLILVLLGLGATGVSSILIDIVDRDRDGRIESGGGVIGSALLFGRALFLPIMATILDAS
jgi:hypothetical protein